MTECVAQAEAHMTTTGRAFSVWSSTKSFSQRNLSDAITASVFLSELYQQLFPTSLSKKCDLNQSSMLQGSTHSAGLWMDFPSWVTYSTAWGIIWAGPAKKLKKNQHNPKCFCVIRIFQIHASPSYKTKMFPKFGQFGWSKFRFLHIFSYPQTQMSTVAKSMHGMKQRFTLWIK